jgi:single-strand DNA-binding protein
MNIVIIQGNLGKEPEVKELQGNNKLARLSVATNESKKDKTTNEWVDKAEWHNVIAWGYLADKASKLSKGSRVLIQGKLETQKWQDSDGNNRYTTSVIAKTLTLLDKLEEGSSLKSANAQAFDSMVEDLPF